MVIKKIKVAFCSLGCKVNQYETNAMMQECINNGYEIREFNEFADVYIVNTCTVTNMADRKSRQMLRKMKEINKNAIVVACGCYAQIAREELKKIEEIDIIIGNNEKKDLVKIITDKMVEKTDKIKEEISDVLHQEKYVEFGTTTYTEKTRAVVKIQDGCDRFCSYCIIPYARGKVRSRKLENIINEVQKIANNGIKEIVITGIHIASYGKDFNYEIKLIDVLEALNKIEGIERIRLGSLEPTLITEDFIERLIKLNKVCNHFHLSLQSGCDDTLKRMNRKYNTKEFKKSVELIRKNYKDAIITTDIIVGFPGETEQEFLQTYKFLQDIKFYKMHVFKYSQRKGTKAAQMPNQVDSKIKEERSKKLIQLSNQNSIEYNVTKINENIDVLVEELEDNFYKGHSKNYILVKIPNNGEDIVNTIQKVKIEQANIEYLTAYKM